MRAKVSWMVRWGGVAAAAVALVAYLGSFVWRARLKWMASGSSTVIENRRGAVWFGPGPDIFGPQEPAGERSQDSEPAVGSVTLRLDRWPGEMRGGGGPVVWWVSTTRGGVAIPLWMPLVMAAAASGAGWWGWLKAWRRARVGLCRCGYDLEGIAGVCPECGRAPR